MADVSKIEIDDTTYDIKDSTARSTKEDISNKSTSISSSSTDTQYPSAKSVYDYTTDLVNRTDSVDAANTDYSTVMARGIYAGTEDMTAGTTALTSGVIYLVYE